MMNARNDRYVVVDLEATSTGSKAKIIQVGIVVIENGEIIDQYATDVNPHEPLDSHIKELTGRLISVWLRHQSFLRWPEKFLNWLRTVFLLRTMYSLMLTFLQNFSFLKDMNCAHRGWIQLSLPRFCILSLKSIT